MEAALRYVGWMMLVALPACVGQNGSDSARCGDSLPCATPERASLPCEGARWYADADADGYGDPASSTLACEAPAGTVENAEDCDDGDAAVSPDAVEACNGADDDCNGEVDDAVECAGETPQYPSEVFSLADWKLTLPVYDPDDASKPLEIDQPALATYLLDPWFGLAQAGGAVRFAANAGGATTANSHYPRSELREMTAGGAEKANWSTSSGVHTMTITEAITHLPDVKPHVVAGQIHDAEDDVMMVRLEGSRLYVEAQGEDMGVLDADYVLGTPFTVRIVAADGTISVYYQDLEAPLVEFQRAAEGCYFKAGVYTQSNPDRGEAPEAYGEVEIRDVIVTHE